jgi:hypothetical protein
MVNVVLLRVEVGEWKKWESGRSGRVGKDGNGVQMSSDNV